MASHKSSKLKAEEQRWKRQYSNFGNYLIQPKKKKNKDQVKLADFPRVVLFCPLWNRSNQPHHPSSNSPSTQASLCSSSQSCACFMVQKLESHCNIIPLTLQNSTNPNHPIIQYLSFVKVKWRHSMTRKTTLKGQKLSPQIWATNSRFLFSNSLLGLRTNTAFRRILSAMSSTSHDPIEDVLIKVLYLKSKTTCILYMLQYMYEHLASAGYQNYTTHSSISATLETS